MSVGIEINLKEIQQANLRIEDGLNRRFEKDAAMYISNQDVTLVKEWLAKGDYELLLSKYTAEKYHPDVYFRTILRNAWLIKELPFSQFKRTILPILEQVQPEYSKKLLRSVAENKMDVPEPLRRSLLGHYAKTVDPLDAEEMIENGNSLGLKRVSVLVQRVLGHYAGTTQFFTKWKQFTNQYPALASVNRIFSNIVVDEEQVTKHFEILFNQYGKEDHPQRYLEIALLNGKLVSFELALENAKAAILKITRQSKGVRYTLTFENMKKWLKLLGHITQHIYQDKGLEDKHDKIFQTLTSFYETVYQVSSFQAGQIVRHCFGKVNHVDFKDNIIQYFKTGKYHVQFEDDVKALEKGKSEHAFKDVKGLLQSLSNTSSIDMKQLRYFAFTFSKLDSSGDMTDELLAQIDLNNPTHYSFLIFLLGDRRMIFWQKIIEYAKHNPEIDRLLYRAVCNHVPQKTIVKTYMHRNHFQKYCELYGV